DFYCQTYDSSLSVYIF
nr:immunoglobulin light chain junction region [Macaca mulatta]MOX11501.1 immunoglobulin light chain junction region [Macaca mulatta]MOX11628.1 immunoglobulin light chain junction region [Macaca mulatta]MOX11789.1 immunoglobulin light chain junction region [Macaca mulatta]MOX12462.1 immunoglobulin light chain junction region [Macaca mulatta]